MFKFNKPDSLKCAKIVVVIILMATFLLNQVQAQNCTYTVHGTVVDYYTQQPLSRATVFVKERNQTTITDSSGKFILSNLCAQAYHLSVTHVACATQDVLINIPTGDTTLTIQLLHASKTLDSVVLHGIIKPNTPTVISLKEHDILENAATNLGNMLSSINGVNAIRTGNTISKPVINGLYGSRVLLINNGVPQNGQQWGSDHSPEIDPLAAQKITVVKGVTALQHQGSGLGSIILVESNNISKDPHVHGRAGYFFETNGKTNGIHFQTEASSKLIAWRINGNIKKSGDKKTPHYFLSNTGNDEVNGSLQLEKNIKQHWNISFLASTFNTKIGILKGSQIGNLTDLQSALTRKVPYFTDSAFSYHIGAPNQEVHHHLFKLKAKQNLSQTQWLTYTYALQIDNRKEFDVRRGNRTDIPSLSLHQTSQFGEILWHKKSSQNYHWDIGSQITYTNNINNPNTGILPLIPNYTETIVGIFATGTKQYKKISLEGGLRADYDGQQVTAISQTTPRTIKHYNNNFVNANVGFSVAYQLTRRLKLQYFSGFANRNPAINELYSNGLHQGVSGIEEGDPNLKTERSFKNSITLQWSVDNNLFFEGLAYSQLIHNYIYLQPQQQLRLTIRGAFPVFQYEQTNAHLTGIDASLTYNLTKRTVVNVKGSYLKGKDVSHNIPLVNMPANQVNATISYEIPEWKKIHNINFELNGRYVSKQTYLLSWQDYVPPPNAYFLLNGKIAAEKQIKKFRFSLYTKVDNMLNTVYRDYLNRQRYFADDLGRNITIGLNIHF